MMKIAKIVELWKDRRLLIKTQLLHRLNLVMKIYLALSLIYIKISARLPLVSKCFLAPSSSTVILQLCLRYLDDGNLKAKLARKDALGGGGGFKGECTRPHSTGLSFLSVFLQIAFRTER